jgi:hypothetical protein
MNHDMASPGGEVDHVGSGMIVGMLALKFPNRPSRSTRNREHDYCLL